VFKLTVFIFISFN